jgi:KRAB domain-containing zinc finger protein
MRVRVYSPIMIFLHLVGSLRRHVRSHEERTRYDCTECDKSFTQVDEVLEHQRNHTANSSYKCMHCDKVFSG